MPLSVRRPTIARTSLIVLAVLACQREGAPATAATDLALAASIRAVPLALASVLAENSAAAASVAEPGLLFGVNDSGHDAVLFAFDTTGADRGRWRLQGATNRDWEAVAVARCEPGGEAWCVFVGDVGDNDLDREHVTIYRVPEPTPIGASEEGTLVPDVLALRFDDRPHNIEAMVVAPDGSLLLLTKEPTRSVRGRVRPTLVYRAPPPGWGRDSTVVAALEDSLPIVPGAVPGQSVTDAALSPGGGLLAVRSYRALFVFAADSATARPIPGRPPVVCDLSPLREAQGEGVGFLHEEQATAGRFAFTTEGAREPLRLATCPLPSR